jgi:hypothetical protein
MIDDTITSRFHEAAKFNDHLLFIELADELKAKMHNCIEGNDLIGLETHRDTLMHALNSVASQPYIHDHWGLQTEEFVFTIAHMFPVNSKAAFRQLGAYPLLDDYLLRCKIEPEALNIAGEDYKVLLENCLLRQHFELFEQSIVGLMKQISELQPTESIYRRVVFHVLSYLGAYPDVGEFSEQSKVYLEHVLPRLSLPASSVSFSNMIGLRHAGLLKTLLWRIEKAVGGINEVDFYTKDERQLHSLYDYIRPELTTSFFTKLSMAMLDTSGALARKLVAHEVFGSDQYPLEEFTSTFLSGTSKPDSLYLLIEQYLVENPDPASAARNRLLHVLNAAIESDEKRKGGYTPERFEQLHRIPKSFYSETDWGMVDQLEGDLGL